MATKDILNKLRLSGSRTVVIAGATASGKSALALSVAEAVNGAIINADSMQVYANLDILTARPSADDCARVPHLLYGHISGATAYSVGQYVTEAKMALASVHDAGQVAIITGGSGLYLKAILQGLVALPAIPSDVRETVRAEAQNDGIAPLYHELQQKDPLYARALNATDGQRIVRAIEVIRATGQSLLSFQANAHSTPIVETQAIKICLMPPREWLYNRINQRFEQMWKGGALDEVRHLLALDLSHDLPVMKAVGVPEIRAYLTGHLSQQQAVEAGQQATRRYAKRQITWFRHQLDGFDNLLAI